jgi:hypothetical protein
MDVRFCEGRNHRREAQVRAADAGECGCARSSEARVRRTAFPLDKDLHGCRQTLPNPIRLGLPVNREELIGVESQIASAMPTCGDRSACPNLDYCGLPTTRALKCGGSNMNIMTGVMS